MTTEGGIQRSILPVPDRTRVMVTTYDAKDPNTRFPPIESIRPPQGAPNVLVVLLDDVGFGASSAFGGPVKMPTAERLAAGGPEYTRFHTTALCSPTRQAGPTGAFDQWPTGGGGFEYLYGFLGGECSQYEPELYEGTTPVTPPRTAEEGYHLTEDLADKAINWVRQLKALIGDTKPFFTYFAPGATHAPHHVPKEWADRYKGQFDHGWDRQRELTFARQKALGVIPLDDRFAERFDPRATGAPTLALRDSQLLFPGMGRLSEWSVLSMKNVSFSVTAEVEVPDRPADGVIIAQGGRFGGWSLSAKDGRAEFAYDGGGLGKGGTLTLYYDGREVGRGRIEQTQPVGFSSEETTDVGKDNFSHLIRPEDRLRVVMTRQ